MKDFSQLFVDELNNLDKNVLLTELCAHANDTNRDFVLDLLPLSKNIQEKCHSLKKSEFKYQGSKSMGSRCVIGFHYC